MDFEKMSEELAEEEGNIQDHNCNNGESGAHRDRYNTRYLVADLKQSNRTPKIIIIVAAVLIAGGIAAALLMGGNEKPAAANDAVAPAPAAAPAAPAAAKDSASDTEKK